MRLIWAVLCSNASIDRTSNNISLQTVIEQYNLTPPPPIAPGEIGLLPVQLDLVTHWLREPEDDTVLRARTTLRTPDGTAIKEINYEVQFVGEQGTTTRARHIAHINGFPVAGPGYYEFVVELERDGWEVVARVPIEVIFG